MTPTVQRRTIVIARVVSPVVLAFALVVFGTPAAGSAQARVTGADLEGHVRDESGGVLADAVVTVVNTETDVARTIETDARGRFRALALPPGSYRSRSIDRGFAHLRRDGIVLLLGQSASLDFTMKLATAEEGVTVVAETPVVDARQTAVSTVVRQEQVESLPIDGRNFMSFTVITPGVTTDRTPQQGATGTSGLSFTGQRGRSNNIMVDGLDNNDPTVGAVRATFSQEAIREFQVLTNSYSAEFGKAAGGVVNIVTRSGTNELRGTAFSYYRDEALNAKDHFERFDPFGNPIEREKAPFRQVQWGGVLGGPVRKDRTFFFGSFERLAVDANNFVNIDPHAADGAARERLCRRAGTRAVRDPHDRGARQDRSSVLADECARGPRERRRTRPTRTSSRSAGSWRGAAAPRCFATTCRSPPRTRTCSGGG